VLDTAAERCVSLFVRYDCITRQRHWSGHPSERSHYVLPRLRR